jgi:ABC-type Fe3+-hydroxamate transport system substrate-binding protein
MKWNQSTWNTQFGSEYGEPITLATVAAITTIVGAVGGTGLSVGLALKQAADRRQAARIVKLKRKRKAIKLRAQQVAQRRQEAESQIAESKQLIAAARAKAQDRTPWVLYAGAAGLVVVSFIAARAARRG